jgi:hypothetical protein
VKVTPSPTATRCVVAERVRADGTALAEPDELGLGLGEPEGTAVPLSGDVG